MSDFKAMPENFAPVVQAEKCEDGGTVLKMFYADIGLAADVKSLDALPDMLRVMREAMWMGWELCGADGSGSLSHTPNGFRILRAIDGGKSQVN